MKLSVIYKYSKIVGFVLIVMIYFYSANLDLYEDVINPDGINWHNRTKAFTEALQKGEYGKTYQVYHPGITLMWISGPVLNLFHTNTVYSEKSDEQKATFLDRDYYAKLSLVAFSAIVFMLTFIVLWRMIGYKFAAVYSVLFVLEPFILGMRRLYHLDYLMTILIFLGFLLVMYYSYKFERLYLLPVAGLSFAMAILTKSAAVMILPVLPFIILLGNAKLYKKILASIILTISLLIFLYALFPPAWRHPIKSFPKYYEKIAFGISDIGMKGRKEIGVSGKGDSVTLDDTLKDKNRNFYISSLFMRLTAVGAVLLIISLGVYIYLFLRGFVRTVCRCIKEKKLLKTYSSDPIAWLSYWSFGIAIAVLIALSIAVKKSDRYEILVFPFLLTVVAYFISNLNKRLVVGVITIYIAFVANELRNIHPYYLAYSNPLMGGIKTRLYTLDDDPFGIGSYEAFQIAKNDMEKNDYNGYYTISGTKSIKAISDGGKFSRFPSCVTDYVIAYSLDDHPINTCVQKYERIGSVKISGFDYWLVYKRLNQKHESNYD